MPSNGEHCIASVVYGYKTDEEAGLSSGRVPTFSFGSFSFVFPFSKPWQELRHIHTGIGRLVSLLTRGIPAISDFSELRVVCAAYT